MNQKIHVESDKDDYSVLAALRALEGMGGSYDQPAFAYATA